MNLVELKDSLPEYAKDIKLNLSALLSAEDAGLTVQQVAGIVLACAYASKQKSVIEAARQSAADVLNEMEINGVKAATTIMAMNNIYYRFVHLSGDKEFHQLPAKLRMNIMANPGIPKVDFEIYALAVSAINGCGMCIEAHVKTLLHHGLSKETIQQVIRIASTVHALAQVAVIENQ